MGIIQLRVDNNITRTIRAPVHATVETLPTHGDLYVAVPGPCPLPASKRGARIVEAVDQRKHVAPCYGDCAHKFGVGNSLSTPMSIGSVAQRIVVSGSREVIYVPHEGYRGQD